jgi:hypothetical protein
LGSGKIAQKKLHNIMVMKPAKGEMGRACGTDRNVKLALFKVGYLERKRSLRAVTQLK